MADVQGLYIVTAVVLAGLFGWVVAVLARAPNATDETKRPRPAPAGGPPPRGDEAVSVAPPGAEPIVAAAPPAAPAPAAPTSAAVLAAAATLVATVIVADEPEKPPVAEAPPGREGPLPPVVVLPPIRNRLDSHPEIQDSLPNATVIVMPEEVAGAKQARHLALVTAVGRSDPEPGKQPERHAIVEKAHLFVFTDGAGRKAGADLVGTIALDALTSAFEKDEPSAFVDDPKLSARANRLRRAVLAANRLLLKRARAMAFAGLGASGLAAHFSPSNEELFVAHVGANRAYRLRGGAMTRLTSPHGTRQLGLVERVEVEVVTDATQPGDVYLFCSDGLGRALGDADLAAALGAAATLEETTARLIAAAGAKENAKDLVAIVVRVDAAAPPVAPTPERKPGRAKTVMGLG